LQAALDSSGNEAHARIGALEVSVAEAAAARVKADADAAAQVEAAAAAAAEKVVLLAKTEAEMATAAAALAATSEELKTVKSSQKASELVENEVEIWRDRVRQANVDTERKVRIVRL
jgi:hypothetical protein